MRGCTYGVFLLAMLVFAALATQQGPQRLTSSPTAEAADQVLRKWSPQVCRRARVALWADALVLLPLLAVLAVLLTRASAASWTTAIGVIFTSVGITADAVEDMTALRLINRRSPRLVPAMRLSSRTKWLTLPGLALLLRSAAL